MLSLEALLEFLSHYVAQFPLLGKQGEFPHEWLGWRVSLVAGGHNNRLFRASGPSGDLAIKFTRRDARDRAGREYVALSLLEELGLEIAPKPVFLERERYAYPVVVQTWMEGEAGGMHPSSDEEWRLLIEHYAAVHSIHPSEVNRSIPNAVLSFAHPREAAGGVLMELARILALEEDRDRPWYQGLSGLAGLMAKATFSTVPAPCLSFARCDPNITNFVRIPGRWASVDWENSGWSDPAFELGDLAAHPAYLLCGETTLVEKLHEAAGFYPGDPDFFARAREYRAVLLARFCGVFARYWRDRDCGTRMTDSTRLSPWPEQWWQELPTRFEQYLHLAVGAVRGI